MRDWPFAPRMAARERTLLFLFCDEFRMSTQLSLVAPAPSAPAPAPASTPLASDRIGTLAQWVEPIASTMPVLAVGERFLDASNAAWLSLPVVESGRPVGSVSR